MQGREAPLVRAVGDVGADAKVEVRCAGRDATDIYISLFGEGVVGEDVKSDR